MNNHIHPTWNELLPAEALKRLDNTSFLSRCRNESVTRKELEVFLVQQHHYSRHFTRYLCALLVNLRSEEDRNALIENLFEEMGLGDLGSEPHSKIYRDMLAALGLNPAEQAPLPETTSLVESMLKLCSDSNPIVGLGAICLGAEAIVPHLYSQIMKGLLSAGFSEENLKFFPLHIEGDDEHALTMKEIIDRELSKNPDEAKALKKSAEESIKCRAAFFEAISRKALEQMEEKETQYAV